MKQRSIYINTLLLAWLLPTASVLTAKDEPVSWWSFDERGEATVLDEIGRFSDPVRGHYRYVEGVSGAAIKFDEFSTVIRREADLAPALEGDFSIEAWIAPRAYPWNRCPIVMQQNSAGGYFFGIDAEGRFGLRVAVDGQCRECISRSALPGLDTWHIWNSDDRFWTYEGKRAAPLPPFRERAKPVVPLLKWSHLVGTFSEADGLVIYLNGKEVARLAISGKFSPAQGADLLIGRDPEKSIPAHTERLAGTLPFNFSFDGLLDEVRIYSHALSPGEVEQAYRRVQPSVAQPLQFRRIPTGPAGPAPFGAFHTCLAYDEDYDRQFRVGEYADVVVTFDQNPFKLVFWHGINYYPIWYAENGIGLMHEAGETSGEYNCMEAMMDRQVRYSRVRIIENNDARVKIHWRHAMSNIVYNIAHEDPVTGWGDWCDDYYTIYPDGVAARKLTVWCSVLDQEWHSFEQDNFVVPIGLHPSEVLHEEGSTLANLKGEETQLSWAETGRPQGTWVNDPVIQTYNIRARSRPFMITYPGVGYPALEGNGMPWPFSYYWWNHWPATQIPCDGRQVYMVDGRPSSTCLAGAQFAIDRPENERTAQSVTQYTLLGMTMDQTAGQLAPLARSWAQPPEVEIPGDAFVPEGYSIAERCYTIRRALMEGDSLALLIKASENSPVVNPALVIENWGDAEPLLTLNDEPVPRGRDFRYGYRHTLDGSDLIIWIRKESIEPVRISLAAVGN